MADHGGRPEILQAWLGNKTTQNVLGWLSSPTNHAVVAERVADGTRELVGLALLNQAGKVPLCYVRPDLLRHGVGRALLCALEAQARAWNIRKVHMQSPGSASGLFEAETVPARKRFCNCSQ